MSDPPCLICNKTMDAHRHGGTCIMFTCRDPRADEIESLRADLAEARETIIAFAGPWATQYARDFGLPDGHLHPTHYDILAKAGARMDSFTRSTLTQTKDTTDDA